jgi:DNA invertase Pin-like site-specific DNA recombinase
MSEKICERHVARKAMLYVRQSTTQQVVHNEESRRLQYAMKGRLQLLGFREVEIVDEDLGKSAAGTTERSGFERLVSEVSLGKVGAVGAREVSRLARNSRDWQKLMEVCRYVDTLLIDHEAVYDVHQINDRLLLGLKGNLNEYELELLRVRAQEARMEKVRRGEFHSRIAVGFRKGVDGQLEKDPDARVQHVVGLVFAKQLELGSVRQVLLWMREHEVEIPVSRDDRHEVTWKPARYTWLYDVLTNATYAGCYVYGRTKTVTTMSADGRIERRVVTKPGGEATVLLPDRHDGYIDRRTFDRIQAMITSNNQSRRARGPGAARIGQALLSGLLRCRRCGRRLAVGYSGATTRVSRYACIRANADHGEPRCISFSGLDVDDRVVECVLEVVQPAAIEAAKKLAEHQVSACDDVAETIELEVKAARYAADRARRQYDAAEPENRLVVDELERRWNAALERQAALEARLLDARGARTSAPVDASRFASLGANVARVWHDAATDIRLKKRIIRTLVEEIVVDTTEREALLVIHWKGGVHTELAIARRRRGQNRNHAPTDTIEAVRQLARVCNDEGVARALNGSDIRTPKNNVWTRELVRSFRSTHEIVAPDATRWLTLAGAAELAGVAELTLKRAIDRGVIRALRPVARGPWIISRKELLEPGVLQRITKKPRTRSDTPDVPTSNQLSLVIPRM